MTMHKDLQRWLDGELDFEQLSPELQEEGRSWQALLDARPEPEPASPWLADRVMASLPERRAGWQGALSWVLQPRTLRFRPVSVAAGAAALLAVMLLFPNGSVRGPQPEPQAAARAANGDVYVQFMYVAREAEVVSVAGDFNQWSAEGLALEDPDGDGIWTGEASLAPGLHKYMFVVDGHWVTDPLADRHVDDGFGNRNALIEVPTSGGAI